MVDDRGAGLVEGSNKGLVSLEHLLDEVPVLFVDCEHILHKVSVDRITSETSNTFASSLSDMSLDFINQHCQGT